MRAARLLPLLAVTTALDRCVEWATVCAPPGCDGNATLVELARKRASAAGRRWTVLGAAARITNADAKTRSEKLRLVRDWIRRDGPRCDFVIFADATDVVAGAGADETIRDAVRTLTRGDAAALVVAGEAACYVGKPCSTREAEALVARAAAAPGGQPFPNSGLYAGSVEAVAAFVDFAVPRLDAATPPGALPEDFPLDRRRGRAFCCDQCALGAYALARPTSVVVDAEETLFGTAKRFYDLADGSRRSAEGRKMPPPPSDACAAYEPKPKRFAGGLGFHCRDAANFQRRFSWAVEGGLPALALAGAPRPLVGWHFNGAAARPLLAAALEAMPA